MVTANNKKTATIMIIHKAILSKNIFLGSAGESHVMQVSVERQVEHPKGQG